MSAATVLTDKLRDRLTPAVVITRLKAMAAMLNLRPSLRHHLRDVHPAGARTTFEATIQFVTWDGSAGAHAIFSGGKMRVASGPAEHADTTVRFRTRAAMSEFFAGKDSFAMLLDNTLRLEGNLSYLFKFGHLSAVVTRGGKKRSRDWGPTGWPDDWRNMATPQPGEPQPAPLPDAPHLDEPHFAANTLDDFPRIKEQLWRFRTAEPAICTERPRLLTEWVLDNRDASMPAVLRQAHALRHIMRHKRAIVRDGDLLAGTTTTKPMGIIIFPELGGTGMWPELLTMEARELNPYRITDEEIDVLNRQVFPFWMDDNVREWTKRNDDPRPLELDERFVFYFMWKTQALSHTVIDVPRALSRGLLDIQQQARDRAHSTEDPEARSVYEAMDIALEGVLEYADALARTAESQARQLPADAPRREELLELARICRKVPARPAETLHEALQAIWTLFIAQHMENMNAGMVVGRLDTWLQPYLERDLETAGPAGRGEVIERALELCCALMLRLTDHQPMVPDAGNRLFGGSSENQVITLGGVTPDGRSAVCDMTWIWLKATEMLRLKDPNVNARFAPGINSEAYLRRLCEVNALTRATPSLHNDDAVVSALEAVGFSVEDARDWTATGCVEPTSCGRHLGHTNCMMLNLVAPLEMALHDGVHPLLGERIGPRTGDPRTFETFEDFFAAYRTQLGWVIDRSVEANNALGRAHQTLKPTPLLSALFDGPMESGRDVTAGGARYNTSGTAMIGLADVVDSLSAIEQLVFARETTSMGELLDALERDFDGCELLLARLTKKAPKLGQDDPRPRAIADALQTFVLERFAAQPHYRGGRYLPGYWSMSNHVAFGVLSGALPSGRRRGKPFTPGLTPSPLSGASLTEQIRSVATLDPTRMPNNIAFNVKVAPGLGDSHDQVVDRMTAYAKSYFELGGMQMQFNVISSQTLRDAAENPDNYRDLLVRISGYNAYFVELNRDIQMELIERTEHSLGA